MFFIVELLNNSNESHIEEIELNFNLSFQNEFEFKDPFTKRKI